MGTASFSGPGAGRYPTANSVVNDLVRLGTGKVGQPFPFDKVSGVQAGGCDVKHIDDDRW